MEYIIISNSLYESVTCESCGFQYAKGDQMEHSNIHDNFGVARQLYPWLCTDPQYRNLKEIANRIMTEEVCLYDYEERLAAATDLLRAYFSDNLRLYEYRTHLLSFSDFAAMFIKANRNRFPEDILESLIVRYGEQEGIEPGKSYYRVP